jgi:diguanylate cyclase (GGDEF)-like protein
VDSAARLGGDEFGIVLPDVALLEDVEFVGEKVLQAVRQPFIMRTVSCTLGASIGIAIYPDHGETADELISRADKAMYQVKKNGKGGIEIYRRIDSDREA